MNKNDEKTLPPQPAVTSDNPQAAEAVKLSQKPKEFGGPKGPEPTRYGDWEKAGRCIDF